ncbi:MAG: alanine--tRNA ligase, partial [Bacteroidales bacterium]|nr:alanine--tRNA ligase [Bacteroidales bacterium]
TMFEMLGNWSFGDYFKKEAIAFAWEYLTEVVKLDKDRLYVTIFEGAPDEGVARDTEAYEAWNALVSADRIIDGNKHDNFWEMGDTGPCGPCSEIHFDMRPDSERKKINGRDLVNKDNPQVIEIWNLVFMQFNRKADGNLEPLPNKHVDTGMGFERLVRAIQHKTSNYDTDVFTPLLDKIGELAGVKYGKDEKTDIAMRVMADHVRTISFSIADGQLPSNNRAGYVIRRILRRAVRYNYTFLGGKTATLYKIVPTLIDLMGTAYPELKKQQELIEKVIKEEEDAFLKTLSTGITMLDSIIGEAKGKKQTKVSGKVAFELYDTYGFPLDLTELILRENGMSVDTAEFEKEMAAQKERARNAAAVEAGDWVALRNDDKEDFLGYDMTEAKAQVVRYRTVKSKNKEKYQVVLNQTPFYGESGGQVGDRGVIKGVKDGKTMKVVDTVKENGLIVHIVDSLLDDMQQEMEAQVDVERRRLTAANHSATHLLQEALREVLGSHVEQKGSLVSADSLRFDFSHFQRVTEEEIEKVERLVNAKIRRNVPLEERRDTPIEEARKMGAMALFGEKYGDKVRVVKFGESVEFCGGTHVQATGEIGMFKIMSESSVSAGVRRIEAITALKAEELVYEQTKSLKEIGELLKGTKDLVKGILQLIESNQALTKQADDMIGQMMASEKASIKEKAETIGDKTLLIAEVKPMFAPKLKDLAYQLRGEYQNAVVVLGCIADGKPQLMIIITDELVKNNGLDARTAIKDVAKFIQGGGGGQAFFASAGGKNAEGMEAALREAKYFFTKELSK